MIHLYLKDERNRLAKYSRFSVANSSGLNCIISFNLPLNLLETGSVNFQPSFEFRAPDISKLIIVKGTYIRIDCINIVITKN